MHRSIPALLILSIAGCGTPRIETQVVIPHVPADLRTPCEISDRKVKTVNELAALATEHLRSAECANSKIVAIDDILTKAEG